MLFFAQYYPPNQISPKSNEKHKFQFLKSWTPQIFFERSAIAKLSKLEPFAWYHWIRNCLNYCLHLISTRHPRGPQNGSTFPNKNWKPFLQHEHSHRFFPNKTEGPKSIALSPYRSTRWAKIDHIWARDPSGESRGTVAIFEIPPTSRDERGFKYSFFRCILASL